MALKREVPHHLAQPGFKGGVNMKIAISSTEPNPDAQVDLRFGRCRCFALVDVDTDTYD